MDEEPSSPAQAAKDLFAGAVGGVAQVLIGQPFDIVKVRLQTTSQYGGAVQAAAAIYRHEGAAAFYRGTLAPLVGIGACVSVQFGAYHAAARWLAGRRRGEGGRGGERPSAAQHWVAGAVAGLANAPLAAPIEHVRIRLQARPPPGAARPYAGAVDCARRLAVAHPRGLVPALYRGLPVTAAREAVAYGAWFAAFEALIAADPAAVAAASASASDSDSDSAAAAVPAWRVALYGGLAGEALWLASYPLDVVKSRMQTDAPEPARRAFPTVRSCVADTWRAHGPAGFWRGIAPTLVRAMPVSAGTFAVVEMTRRALA